MNYSVDWDGPGERDHDDVVKRARSYLEMNAAESGADVLIAEMADEIERLRLLYIQQRPEP